MRGRKSIPELNHGQRGLALLIFAILISLLSITVYFKSFSVNKIRIAQQKQSSKTLFEAKRALLAYAALYSDSDFDDDGFADHPGEYGFLPCPSTNDAIVEGGSDGNCDDTGKNTIGLLPWKTLETSLIKSGSGSCYWYVVSGDYKSNPKSKMLNEDSNGLIRLFRQYDEDGDGIPDEVNIAGNQPQDRPVALVIDPGRPVAVQLRGFEDDSICGEDDDATHFLEGNGNIDNGVLADVADAIDDFIHTEADSEQNVPPYNDRIAYITRDEIWRAVLSNTNFAAKMQNLTRALAMCIAAYGNNAANRRLPRPAPVDFGAADYRLDGDYDDTAAASYLGRYPHTVDNSDADTGASAPVSGVSVLFDKGFCDALDVGGGVTVNLDTGSGSEYYKLWENWKDHFFYAVSTYYAPSSAGIGVAPNCTGANCITVGGTEYAAAVIYSGSRTGGQVRNAPVSGDADTKNILTNYLEVANPAGNGAGDYTPAGNDIVFCITDTDPLSVVSCS